MIEKCKSRSKSDAECFKGTLLFTFSVHLVFEQKKGNNKVGATFATELFTIIFFPFYTVFME